MKGETMTVDRMIELLRTERECVLSARSCGRDCEHCTLVQKDGDLIEMYDGVIKRLQQQKAHILTREEIEALDGYTWEEYRDSAILQVTLIRKQFVRERLELPYHISELNWAAYGKEWRLWSAQPTEEQRKAVKWDG